MAGELIKNNTGLKSLLESMRPKIQQALPKHITPERIFKAVGLAVTKSPKLLQCTKESVILSIMQASELGIDCGGGALADGYLIPYGNEAVFIISHHGMRKLALQSDKINNIVSDIVYENELKENRFKIIRDTSKQTDNIVHDKILLEEKRGKVAGAYCAAYFNDNTCQSEFMTIDEVMKIAKRSKAYSNGPWQTDQKEMCRKVVVKRLCKHLPRSVDDTGKLEKAYQYDGDVIEINPNDYDVEEKKPGSTTDALAARLTNGKPESDSIPAEEPETPPEPKEKPKTGAEKLAEAKAAMKRREERLAKEKQDAAQEPKQKDSLLDQDE